MSPAIVSTVIPFEYPVGRALGVVGGTAMNIRRLLEPGDYPIEWRLADGTSVSGVLTLASAETVTGMAYGLPAEPPSAEVTARIDPSWTVWEPSVKPCGMVRGELRNNLDVAFPDAYVSHQLPGPSMLMADLAVCGARLRENTDLLFDEIMFRRVAAGNGCARQPRPRHSPGPQRSSHALISNVPSTTST